MADYFEHMSVFLPLKKVGDRRKRAWWAKVDEALQSAFDDDSEQQEFLEKLLPEEARDCTVCSILLLDDGVCVTDDEGVLHTDGVAAIFMAYLEKFDPTGHVRIEIAFTCSKHRSDGFGGCSMVVTAKEAKWFTTHDGVNKLALEMGLDPKDQRNRR